MSRKTRLITQISALSAIAAVLMLFEFPMCFAPGFYKMDFSDLPALIGGFAIGPIAAILIEFIKNLINLLINGTVTACIGEFSNFIIGCSFVLPAALIYKYNKTKKFAVIGMIIGTLTVSVVGGVMNAYVLIPAYAKLLNLPLENIISMGNAVNRNVSNLSTLVLYAVVPFNFVKGVVISLITSLIYKKIRFILK